MADNTAGKPVNDPKSETGNKAAGAESAAPSSDKATGSTYSTPVFGSSSTFGTGTGFSGFTGTGGVTESASAQTAENGTGDGEEGAGGDEDYSAEFAPVVQLNEVETVSGEEAENILVDFKCKLYRFENDSGEWKERGVGQVKLLENKENKRIRLLHRQEKTLKIRANHILMPGTKLQEHTGSEKAWVWSAVDFADEVQKPELFCIRFGSVERAQEFKKGFESAVTSNTTLLGEDAAGDDEPAAAQKAPDAVDELAQQAEGLAVKDDPQSAEVGKESKA